jgi:hypothetical protein
MISSVSIRGVVCVAILVASTASPGPAQSRKADAGLKPVSRFSEQVTVWDAEHSPVVLRGDVVVERNATLTIEPGVEVRGGRHAALIIKGVLRADGSIDQPVVFRPNAPDRLWDGIRFIGTGGVRQPDARSSLSHAVVRGARTAVAATYDSPRITDTTFIRNGRGINLVMPRADLEIEGIRVLRNGIGVSGSTSSTVTISGSDFYANRINLVLGPKRPYDCVRDDGDWEVHRNDILRGPDDPYVSNDVRAMPGSRFSGVTIDATLNYWDGLESEDVEPRIFDAADDGDSWGDGTRRAIQWDPWSPVPTTGWLPPDSVSHPPREARTHPDIAKWTFIGRPEHGDCVPADRLAEFRGTGFEGGGDIHWVDIAVKRVRGERCFWMTGANAQFRAGPCARRVWLRAQGRGAWRLALLNPLPPGRYVAVSRADSESQIELDRNKIFFTVR